MIIFKTSFIIYQKIMGYQGVNIDKWVFRFDGSFRIKSELLIRLTLSLSDGEFLAKMSRMYVLQKQRLQNKTRFRDQYDLF